MSPDTASSSSATYIPPELPFRIKLGVTGRGLVEVAGLDLSSQVTALSFDARAGAEINRLMLELRGDTELEGLAQVTVVRPGAADALADIDPDELEAEALRRLEGFDDRSLTAVMLEVLGEWLRRG